MNDRFKLRVYVKSQNSVLDIDSFYIDNFKKKITIHFSDGHTKSFNFDDVVLMQCTGFRDTNNNLLYEGDICYDDWSDEFGLILFYEGKFQFSIDNVMYELCDCLPLELHGNIHKNPELLEQ